MDYQYPRSFNIEPTSHCNLKCVMCPRQRPHKKDGYMKMDLFRKIVDETLGYGPRSIVLYKDGEPLLHPEIIEMVRYIKQVNPAHNILISTNGLLLTEKLSQALIQNRLDQLHFSIGAVIPETYNKIRGGKLQQLEDNIRRLIEIKRVERAKIPYLSAQIINMPETQGEIMQFRNKWTNLGVRVIVQELRHWAGGLEDKIPVAYGSKARHPCHALWFAPSVNWDGLVSMCCFDWDEQGIIGDMNTQTLAEIWQSELLQKYRKLHLAGEYASIPLCANCDHYLDYPDLWFSWQKTGSDSKYRGHRGSVPHKI
ncbi:MAG: radical SAM protein [Planctomycetota bacterium]|nr:radical SAM protein [Planctomycetota bacterium]MDI6787086.1 radical SAM protein [Planctomycetota bacterium]